MLCQSVHLLLLFYVFCLAQRRSLVAVGKKRKKKQQEVSDLNWDYTPMSVMSDVTLVKNMCGFQFLSN